MGKHRRDLRRGRARWLGLLHSLLSWRLPALPPLCVLTLLAPPAHSSRALSSWPLPLLAPDLAVLSPLVPLHFHTVAEGQDPELKPQRSVTAPVEPQVREERVPVPSVSPVPSVRPEMGKQAGCKEQPQNTLAPPSPHLKPAFPDGAPPALLTEAASSCPPHTLRFCLIFQTVLTPSKATLPPLCRMAVSHLHLLTTQGTDTSLPTRA